MMEDTMTDDRIDVRCPQGPRNLLMKLSVEQKHVPVHNGLMELVCRDCTKHARRQMEQAGLSKNFRVIHRFAFDGEFVESIREPTE